eukprot:692312-Pleurochrysis_carterae.AAC.1
MVSSTFSSISEPAAALSAPSDQEPLPWQKAFDAARQLERTEAKRLADPASLALIRTTLGDMGE